jgi:uncharacterized Fe-S cluster protein YjdI/CDGSH-type Zn-finger protein
VARRDYSTQQIVVHWDSDLCIHTGRCLRSLPEVFDTGRRPWVTVDAASADEVAATVRICPTGALRYERPDGAGEEVAEEPTTVEPRPDGPLFVRGRVRIVQPDGSVVDEGPRFALCRCGATTNPPFCNNAHRAIGWRSPAAGGADGRRERAHAPDDVDPRRAEVTGTAGADPTAPASPGEGA